MIIDVLLFASYAESVGASSLSIELPEGARVEEALTNVRARSVNALPPKPLVAVNEVYARITDTLRSGDRLAIIPPVAGG
jgi:molybdopterin converting factor small subunit